MNLQYTRITAALARQPDPLVDLRESRRDDEVMSSSMVSPPLPESRRGELMTRLFRELQVARFNELYYQKRASWFRGLATSANIIAALASSAVLTSLLSNGNLFGWGPIVWQVLTAIAAVSAASVPFCGLDGKASQMEKAALGHSILKERLRRLLGDLKLSDLENSHVAREEEIGAFRSALTSLDESPSDRLREQCWKRTLEEFPSEQAWNLV